MVKHIPQIKPLNMNQKLTFFVMKGKLVLRRNKVNVTNSISVLFLFLSIPIKLLHFVFFVTSCACSQTILGLFMEMVMICKEI